MQWKSILKSTCCLYNMIKENISDGGLKGGLITFFNNSHVVLILRFKPIYILSEELALLCSIEILHQTFRDLDNLLS